jgi:hypothetical protein
MRKILLSSLVILIGFSSPAQDSLPRKVHTKDWYLKKTKRQKVVGASLITVGALGLAFTVLSDATESAGNSIIYGLTGVQSPPSSKSPAGGYMFSAASLIGGMIFLGTSAETKKKAITMTAGMEHTETLRYNLVSKRAFPTVGLKIRI